MDESVHLVPGFPYFKLQPDTIRLLRVIQGSSGILRCDLEVVHIARLPSYDALSYTWGDSEDTGHQRFNGSAGLAITRNLHSALLRLRLPERSRLIWADAICINQEDIEERGSQVNMMKDIYRLASSVVVWLGGPIEVDGNELWCIPPLLEAASRKSQRIPGSKDWMKHVLRPNYHEHGDLLDKKWNNIVKSLILMLQRPWFLRTWIIQEVALATRAEVICGNYSASWDDFYCAISYAFDSDYFSSTLPELFSSMQNIETVRRQRACAQYPRLLDLLASFQIFLATNPRDKVFGLLGLLSPSELPALGLKADYEVDTIKVYTQATIDCIMTEGSLDVLSFGGQATVTEHYQLPTWVPDWAYQDRTKPMLPRFLLNFAFKEHQWPCEWQSATGSSCPIVKFSDDSKSIVLSGYVLSRVLRTGGTLLRDDFESGPGHPLMEINAIGQHSGEVLKAWEDICGLTSNTPYRTGEAAWNVYWKTLHAGSFLYGDEKQTKAAFKDWYRAIKDIQKLGSWAEHRFDELQDRYDDDVEDLKSGTPYKQIVAYSGFAGKLAYKTVKDGMWLLRNKNKIRSSRILAFNRILFGTNSGCVGMSSRNTKEGDAIALFQGCKMPIVIREAPGGKWTIVGDAYIHGIMNGEKFDISRCSMLHIV